MNWSDTDYILWALQNEDKNQSLNQKKENPHMLLNEPSLKRVIVQGNHISHLLKRNDN
jgi:hypothetical protein